MTDGFHSLTDTKFKDVISGIVNMKFKCYVTIGDFTDDFQ